MSDGAYGSPCILADGTAIDVSMRGYDKLSSTLETEKKDLETVDSELFNQWIGRAGNSFFFASQKAEKNMNNIITRYKNMSSALNQTNTRFNSSDTTASGNILIAPTSQSGVDN